MSQILKTRRLVNPGRKRKRRSNAGKSRRMSLAQKLHFGTKRQRAAAKAGMHKKRSNPAKRRSRARYAPRRKRHVRRRANVGKIITIRPLPAISNPSRGSGSRRKKGKKRTNSMARTRRRSNTHRRRRNAGSAFGRSWSRRRYRTRPKGIKTNPAHRRRRRRNSSPRVVVRYRNAHRRRRVGRRRNPGMMSGDFSTAVQIVGGAIVTKFVVDMLPASINTGIPSYIATAVVAVLQGKMIGKLLRNPVLGKNMTIGGFVYLSLRLAQDFLPSIGLPFRLGIVGPSSFYTPQVPLNGNMGAFVPPAGLLAAAAPAGMQGLTQRRVGRMR